MTFVSASSVKLFYGVIVKTLGFGSRVVLTDNIEQGVAIAKTLDQFEIARKHSNELRDRKHGHDFRDNRTCRCGMTELNYHAIRLDALKPCKAERVL